MKLIDLINQLHHEKDIFVSECDGTPLGKIYHKNDINLHKEVKFHRIDSNGNLHVLLEKTRKFVCYELDFEGIYELSEIQEIYNEYINKEEYADFNDWIHDMLKSGIIIEL